jgi:transcriptional regulator with XRE-family HTH domain
MANTQTLLDNTARIFRIGRKVIGHTQVDVATALGVSQGTVSKYEAGILGVTRRVKVRNAR